MGVSVSEGVSIVVEGIWWFIRRSCVEYIHIVNGVSFKGSLPI